jgi:hypothetical protein
MSALPDPETMTVGAGPAEPLSPGYGFSRRSGVYCRGRW